MRKGQKYSSRLQRFEAAVNAVEPELKEVENGIYMRSRIKYGSGGRERASDITIYRTKEMTDEQLIQHGLEQYIKEEGDD